MWYLQFTVIAYMTQEDVLRTQHRGQGSTNVDFHTLPGEPTAIQFLFCLSLSSSVLCFGFLFLSWGKEEGTEENFLLCGK